MSKSIEKVVAITGLPGLFILESSKSNGLIVADMDTGKKQFIPIRKHQFSPLQSIAIYTYTDSLAIEEIFKNLISLEAEHNFAELVKADNKALAAFFRLTVPEYDEDRVYPSDMKKVLKWFDFLKQRGYFIPDEVVEEKTKPAAKKKTDKAEKAENSEKVEKPAKTVKSEKSDQVKKAEKIVKKTKTTKEPKVEDKE